MPNDKTPPQPTKGLAKGGVLHLDRRAPAISALLMPSYPNDAPPPRSSREVNEVRHVFDAEMPRTRFTISSSSDTSELSNSWATCTTIASILLSRLVSGIEEGFMAEVERVTLPDDLYYQPENHIWVRLEGNRARVGLDALAQRSAGAVSAVRLKPAGYPERSAAVRGVQPSIERLAPHSVQQPVGDDSSRQPERHHGQGVGEQHRRGGISAGAARDFRLRGFVVERSMHRRTGVVRRWRDRRNRL